MSFWIWTCLISIIWIQALVNSQEYYDDDDRSRASQPKPPVVPGQGDSLPFRPGGGYKGPGNGASATFGFSAYKGPTNGDFDTSIRKFSKAHTLGSFGNSFEGTGDHASVMNKVYNRLQNNGVGHYNREPPPNEGNYNDDDTNSNRNRNYNNPNRYNSNSNYAPSRKASYNSRNQQNKKRYRRNNQQSNPNSYNSADSFGSGTKDPFPNLGSASPHNKNLFPDDLFDFSSFNKQQDSLDSGYGQDGQSARDGGGSSGGGGGGGGGRGGSSGYRQRPNQRRPYRGRQKSGYYPNRRQYAAPQQYLSSNYKGITGGYGNGPRRFGSGGGYGPRPGPAAYSPTQDRLTRTPGGATLLQVTNTRIPKGGGGASFGNMVEDGGRTRELIQFTSGGSNERSIASGGGFGYDNILEDDHSLTDLVSAVATVVGQGNINPAALSTLVGQARRPPPRARAPAANNVRGGRAPPGLYTGGGGYSAGPGYSGGTYVSNHHPLNNGDGGAYVSNYQLLNRGGGVGGRQSGGRGGGGGGGYRRGEPTITHLNGENSRVSFEDSIQNLVF